MLTTEPSPDTTNAPELSPCAPMVRLAAAKVAPLNTDITPVPPSATVALPATMKSASATLMLALGAVGAVAVALVAISSSSRAFATSDSGEL